jgi:hypothetical protein
MKKLNNKKSKVLIKSKDIESLLNQTKVEWDIIKFANRGAYFISNPDSLLGIDTTFKK